MLGRTTVEGYRNTYLSQPYQTLPRDVALELIKDYIHLSNARKQILSSYNEVVKENAQMKAELKRLKKQYKIKE